MLLNISIDKQTATCSTSETAEYISHPALDAKLVYVVKRGECNTNSKKKKGLHKLLSSSSSSAQTEAMFSNDFRAPKHKHLEETRPHSVHLLLTVSN